MVKIFTMVKDEVDIIRDWIIYHGCMFGWDNIYIIDNYSSDGTYEAINEFSSLINIFREEHYSNKGIYMKRLIDQYCINDIAFPIDIDEFIVYYDNNNLCVDKDTIINYFNSLPEHSVYKANYITSVITENGGYPRATVDAKYGYYCDMGQLAKSFINTKHFSGTIDHGNHINCSDYFLTKIHLVHYHFRNIEQLKKKILNNIIGLGYENNIEYLQNLLHNNPNCNGNHHVRSQIKVLEGSYNLDIWLYSEDLIKLDNLSNRILSGYF
jgi:hypothetical protein